MTRTLVIAPQWIGDAVMAEPLLATLAERGEALTVAALPWVAPVFQRDAARSARSSSCRSRTAGSTGRRAAASPRTLRGRFDVAYVLPNSIKSALRAVARAHAGARRLPRRRALAAAQPAPRRARRRRPPMVAFYGALAGAAFDAAPAAASAARAGTLLDATPRRHGLRRAALLGLRAGRRVRARQALAGGALRGARALAARAPTARRSRCSARPAKRRSATRSPRGAAAPAACSPASTSLLDAIALIAASRGLASNDSGLMHVAAALRRAAGRGVRLDQPAAHAAAQSTRARPLAEGRAQLDCMPCFDRTCRFGHYRCLTRTVGAAQARAQRSARSREALARP